MVATAVPGSHVCSVAVFITSINRFTAAPDTDIEELQLQREPAAAVLAQGSTALAPMSRASDQLALQLNSVTDYKTQLECEFNRVWILSYHTRGKYLQPSLEEYFQQPGVPPQRMIIRSVKETKPARQYPRIH